MDSCKAVRLGEVNTVTVMCISKLDWRYVYVPLQSNVACDRLHLFSWNEEVSFIMSSPAVMTGAS